MDKTFGCIIAVLPEVFYIFATERRMKVFLLKMLYLCADKSQKKYENPENQDKESGLVA